jgi:addiction module HigA family antidote
MGNKYLGFVPDYAVAPGETLLETIEVLGMTQSELAQRTGRPLKTINGIIKGKESITHRTALELERVLGIPASFWNNMERNYREALTLQEERARLAKCVEWLKTLPVSAMVKWGWIRKAEDKIGQLQKVLNFFGVVSPDQWEEIWATRRAAFRKSAAFASDQGAIAAWLRKGEIECQKIECAPYDAEKFQNALQQIRLLSSDRFDVLIEGIVRLSAEAGVAVVFVPELPKTRASGATRWMTPTKAMIQLSLRYRTDDHFLFTFFHEAGHILRHGKRTEFIEDHRSDDPREREADLFAADTLIPPDMYSMLTGSVPRTKAEVVARAKAIGISPGVLVGRLQHDRLIPQTHFNEFKRKLTWG